MSDSLPDEFVDKQLASALAVLTERAEISLPMTTAEAMKYARFAYMRGYFDHLAGLGPSEDDA